MTIRDLPVAMVATTLLLAYMAPLAGSTWVPVLALPGVSACLAGSLWLFQHVAFHGSITYFLGGWAAPWGIEVGVDGPGAFLLVVTTGLVLTSLLYAVKGLRTEVPQSSLRWFWTLGLLLMASMMGIVMARDLFNMFVFIEIASLAACGMVSVKGDGPALEAALRYLILSALGTGTLLLGIALIYMATGHLNMAHIALALLGAIQAHPDNLWVGLGFVTTGFGVKAALFPLHTWLPDAHSAAPTPSSTLLSGVAVKVFAFGYWRVLALAFHPVLSQVPLGILVAALGALASVLGSLLAAGQSDLKRLLAYSTVAQVGCVFIGFGLGGRLAVGGAMLHILAHGAMKAGLFMAVGCVTHATGRRGVEDLKGLGRSMPWTMAAFLVMCLSMIGVPPLAGFASKWYLVLGALEQGQPLVAVALVLSSVLTALYLLPLLIRAYFLPSELRATKVPALLEVPVLLLAGVTILAGLFPGSLLGMMRF